MINYISGKLVQVSPASAVIETNGIGYVLQITLNTFSKINTLADCKLFAHLSINSMDFSVTLYGFFDEKERTLFRNLVSVSGVGASTARLILSSLSVDEIHQAIIGGHTAILTRVKGIGEKTAQRIIVDLKNKLDKEGVTSSVTLPDLHNTMRNEALSVLLALGFAKNQSEKAVDLVLRRDASLPLPVRQAGDRQGENIRVEHLVKEAMKII
ncbi:MAG: Holliday junction branch migration protein RuvA [Bacteroidetes bacterium]|nr:Holliday junction branch migration protein RuvA [Bacteroidota bacterium]